MIKGKFGGDTLDLDGRVVSKADFNNEPVPYRSARKSRDTYVCGAQYLLMLREDAGGVDVSWAAPSASNEQIHGENDPWVSWVSQRVTKESH